VYMKKLLLTGAKGFTGCYLSEAAKKEGFEVFPLLSNLTDLTSIKSEVQRIEPDYVIHLGAISYLEYANMIDIYKVNLFGTLNLLEALEELPKKPEKVILASSATVYGNTNNSSISEDVIAQPTNHYAMSKYAMEKMAVNYYQKLPIVITRPFNYTGVGHDLRFVIPKIVDHFKRGRTYIELGNIEVFREFNDVRVVRQIYIKLLEKGVSGQTYNLCSGRKISLRNVITTLEKIAGYKIEVKVNTKFARENEVDVLLGSPKKIEQILGIISYRELEDTLSWMLND